MPGGACEAARDLCAAWALSWEVWVWVPLLQCRSLGARLLKKFTIFVMSACWCVHGQCSLAAGRAQSSPGACVSCCVACGDLSPACLPHPHPRFHVCSEWPSWSPPEMLVTSAPGPKERQVHSPGLIGGPRRSGRLSCTDNPQIVFTPPPADMPSSRGLNGNNLPPSFSLSGPCKSGGRARAHVTHSLWVPPH